MLPRRNVTLRISLLQSIPKKMFYKLFFFTERVHKSDFHNEICLSNWSSEDSTAIHYFNMAVENKRQPNKSFVHKFYGYICNPRVAYWRIHRKLFKTYSPTKVDNQFFKKCFYANN